LSQEELDDASDKAKRLQQLIKYCPKQIIISGIDRYIALHHWHPHINKEFYEASSGTLFPIYLSQEIGGQYAQLSESDRFYGYRNSISKYYWNNPNISNLRAQELQAQIFREIVDNAETIEDLDDIASSPVADYETVSLSGVSKGINTAISIKRTALMKEREAEEEAEEERVAEEQRIKKIISSMTKDQKSFVKKMDKENKGELALLKAENAILTESLKEYKDKADEYESLASPLEGLAGILINFAGICRANLTSKEWHADNPEYCKEAWGFESFAVMLVHLRCRFPKYFAKLDANGKKVSNFPAPVDDNSNINDFEKCLIARTRIHHKVNMQTLATIWGCSLRSIARYIDTWAEKWGHAGQLLSILPITEKFLEYAVPQAFKDAGLEKVGALVDGKVFMTEVCRANSAVKRASWNDKVHHSGVLMHAWILPYGLNFEHTALYLGRLTEGALVKLWGSKFKKL